MAGADMIAVSVGFVLANLVVFGVYRLAFLASFAGHTPRGVMPSILASGLRLDLALLGLELFLLLLPLGVLGRLRPRGTVLALWVLTWAHAAVCFVNFQFYGERNQHVWEMLIANVTRPDQLYVAVAPFLDERRILAAVALLLSGVCLGWGVWVSRRLPRAALTWSGPIRRRALAGGIALLLLSNAELVRIKKTGWTPGWMPLPTASQFYMSFDDYLANQAVINPAHDLIRYYLPANLAGLARFGVVGLQGGELDPEWALQRAAGILDLAPLDAEYPLLREVSSDSTLGIRNVITIAVEGLSGSLIDHTVEGRPVMPFLRRLGQEALYFRNIVQSANATDGAVFSTTTSLPKTFSHLKTQFFLSYEVNGRYGSLPAILGSRTHRHFFLQAFRQRSDDFVGFMGNQGYETHDYSTIAARLRRKHASKQATNALGAFDSFFLEDAAETLAASEKPFTALLVTTTSHSPWSVPSGTPTPFGEPQLDAFHYVDASLAALVEDLARLLPDFDRTLIVLVGDHTSVTFGNDLLERIRIPLFFFGPPLSGARARHGDRLETPGSHVDILPTILDLLGGQHAYAGMGRSLLRPLDPDRGVLSGNRYYGLYLRGGFVLRYSPYAPASERLRLHRRLGDHIERPDLSARHPEILETLRLEYLAQYETARRLVREKRVYPLGPGRGSVAGREVPGGRQGVPGDAVDAMGDISR